jgi:hypothetical protein
MFTAKIQRAEDRPPALSKDETVGAFRLPTVLFFFFSWYSGLSSPAGKPWYQGPPPPASEI